MKVNFHRNFLQVYPFISLLFASGIYTFFCFLSALQRYTTSTKKQYPSIIITSIAVFALLIPSAYISLKDGRQEYHSKDSRTAIIDTINAIPNINKLLIAKELKIHSMDLKRLKKPYTLLPLSVISARPVQKGTLYLLPSHIGTFYAYKNKKREDKLQKFIDSIDDSNIVKRTPFNNVTNIDILSVNPGIILAKDLPPSSIKVDPKKLLDIDFSMCDMPKGYIGSPLAMGMSGTIISPDYSLKRGDYILRINAQGTKAFDEFAKLKLKIFAISNSDHSLLAENIIETTQKYTDYDLDFTLSEDTDISIEVSFINDAGRPEPREDRNAFIKSINVVPEQE